MWSLNWTTISQCENQLCVVYHLVFVGVVSDLAGFYPSTDCVFNPNEQLILTGTSVRKGQVSVV